MNFQTQSPTFKAADQTAISYNMLRRSDEITAKQAPVRRVQYAV